MNVRTNSGELPNDDLPDSLPDISFFDLRKDFKVRLYANGDSPFDIHGFEIHGNVTSLATVPEPTTLLLLSFGGLVLRRKQYEKI